jgi:hypothetical protein
MGIGFLPELGLFEQNIRLRPSENPFSDGLFLLRMNEFDTGRKAAGMQARAVCKAMRFRRFNIRRDCSPDVVAQGYPL